MLAMTRCALILGVLMKRKDADWFEKPVPQETEGYFEMISNPMDYGTIKTKLEAAGHGGASGRYDRWRDRAFEMAWMLTRAGVTQ